jgi:GMP synthase-like glutamine amidotransferase
MHRDAVSSLPPNSTNLAYTTSCPQQGFYREKKYITIQGHPEFNEEIVRELLELRYKTGVFNDEIYGDGMRRVGNGQDGVVVAEAFLRFLME